MNDGTVSGVCTVKPITTGPVICGPIRLYAADNRILGDVADKAFGPGRRVVPGAADHCRSAQDEHVYDRRLRKEVGRRATFTPKERTGAYWADWVLANLDASGQLKEFVAFEVQTIDTTGSYRDSRDGLITDGREVVRSTVGLNFENVSKRILPQLIYKGQILQRESLCRRGLFFVCPIPVYERIMRRLGGKKPH
ncbi:hypothetical protein I6E73_07465 [Salinibacterium sp. SWN248]|nr:hypothetical protein [Salinibacterium sp. SWN248]